MLVISAVGQRVHLTSDSIVLIRLGGFCPNRLLCNRPDGRCVRADICISSVTCTMKKVRLPHPVYVTHTRDHLTHIASRLPE